MLWCGWKTCFGARQPGPKMTATAPFTTCAHWCQTETEMRIETKICKICGICKHPLSALSGWMGGRYFFHHLTKSIHWGYTLDKPAGLGSAFGRLDSYVKFDQGTWLILTPPILNAGYAWDWGQPILDNDLMTKTFQFIERKKEAAMIWGNSKISTKKSLSLQFDSAGGGQREFHWVLLLF